MKKIIGNVGLVIAAIVLFFSTNTNENGLDIAQMIAINSANAENCTPGVDCNSSNQICVIVNGYAYYGYPFHGCV